MLDITVKTLDGRNHKFSVPDDVSVRQFKEKIASSIEIEADVQRLIFQGRVLADEKKINDYDVNGKTVHVVQRPPPSSKPQSSTQGASSAGSHHHDDRGAPSRETNSFVLGSFSLPADAADPNHVQNMVQQMLSGMGDLGRAHITTQNSGNDSVDVQINVTPNPQQSDAENRLNLVSRMLNSARQTLGRLQNLEADGHVAPMDTSEDVAGSAPGSGTSHSAASGPSTQGATTHNDSAQDAAGQSASGPQDPLVSDLSELLGEVLQFNEDFAPHLMRYRRLMADDPNLAGNTDEARHMQQFCDLTSEMLHHMSHIYHSLSDIVVDMSQAPPRRVRATAGIMPQATAVIQQTIPVQAQISVAHVPVGSMSSPPTAGGVPAGGATPTQPEPQGATPNTGSSNTGTTNQPSIPSRAGDQTSQPSRNTSSTNSGSFAGRMTSPWESGMPRIRFGMTGAAMPFPRPPAAFPPGFHMVVEMSQDSATGGAGATQPESVRPTFSQSSGAGAEAPFPDGGLQFPPGDFLQNIIQMAAGAALRGQPGQQVFVLSQGNMQPITVGPSAVNRQTDGAPSTAPSSLSGSTSSAGASTTTTSSAPTSNGGGTGGQGQGTNPPRAGTFTGPRMNGFFGQPTAGGGLNFGQAMGGQLPGIFVDPFGLIPLVDPYLPCSSRHFIPRRPNQPNAAPQMAQPQQHRTSNFFSSMMAPPVTSSDASSAGRGPVPASIPPLARFFVVPNSAASAGMSGGAGGTLQAGTRTPQATTGCSQSASNAAQAGATTGVPTDEVISRLVQGISTQLTQAAFGQQANLTISDFLSSLGNEFNISQGEGLLTDLFNCITQHLVFSDLMMIFFGQVGPVERLRVPLQSFVSGNILLGQEASDANVEAAVTRLMANMKSDIEETAAAAPSHDHIDYRASLTRFIQMNLTSTIRIIMSATDNGRFGQNLYDRCRLAVHEFINLSRFCLRGGVGALDSLIQNRLQVIASEVNPAMQRSMVHMAHQQLHQILPLVSMRDEDIQQYVVLRQALQELPAAESSLQSTVSYETASDGVDIAEEAPGVKSEPLSMEAEPVVRDQHAVNGCVGGGEFGLQRRISAELLAQLPPPPVADDERNFQVVVGSEDWHSKVPSEWVPVITRDVARQRRQAPQSSLSDAYLTGMPSKRRKVMSQERQREEFTDIQVAIPETIRRAAQQVGSQPATSFTDVSNDVAGSSQLRSAFQQEISEAIRQRIASDPDYNPSRFPNISKFFDSKK